MANKPDLDGMAIKRRSSLFVETADAASGSSSTSYKPRYEERLLDEMQSWRQLVRAKRNEIDEYSQNSIRVDASILSEEQRRYLSRGPQVDSYVESSKEFYYLLERYIQRKSFLAQRYDAILAEARAQVDTKALDVAEQRLLEGDEFE